jgi:hypothetical protein
MTALNAVCPYFTMFPLSFPHGVLKRHSRTNDVVLDPFTGRGTTLYAARTLGLTAHGIDSNPVAVAISEAKLANTSPGRIVAAARRILEQHDTASVVPRGAFWRLAYERNVLETLCRLRDGLLANCESDTRRALRAVVMGALHGPRGKARQSYFSNQCPRTYAPKPGYAARFWRDKGLKPPRVDVLEIIKLRAERYFSACETVASGAVVNGDSQKRESFGGIVRPPRWIVTSPPYYGMRTYIPDQWLRHWFIGGDADVDYSNARQLSHASEDVFCEALQTVWDNCAIAAADGCRLVVRFGAINDRKIDARALMKRSLAPTRWRLVTARPAGTASNGKRQVDQFSPAGAAIEEYDFWAELQGRSVRTRRASVKHDTKPAG